MHELRVSRRNFLGAAAGLTLADFSSFGQSIPLRIGVTDWNLKLTAETEAISRAAELGFQGVQISFGRDVASGKMPLDRPELIARYLSLSRQYGITIDGTCVDRLHDNGLKSDPLAMRWVSDAIRLTRDLKTQVLLVPFFGRWKITSTAEMNHVADALHELAPEAEKAGVILGIENTISAEDNARILDKAGSKNVLVYYDVGNSTKAGFDIVKEIRWLGKTRICQIHFKDNPHLLGKGSIQFQPVVKALRDIDWSGWINLETDSRPNQLKADLRQNLAYVRHTIDMVYTSSKSA